MLRLLEYFKREKSREKNFPSIARYLERYKDNECMLENISLTDTIMEMFDTPVKIKYREIHGTISSYIFPINDKWFKVNVDEQVVDDLQDGKVVGTIKGAEIVFEQRVNSKFTYIGITSNLDYREISQLFSTIIEICKLHKGIEYYMVQADSEQKISVYKKLLARLLPNNEINYTKSGYSHILEVRIKQKVSNNMLNAFRNKFKDK